MPKGSQFQDLAAEAAQRIEAARAQGEQLTLLSEAELVPVAAEGGRTPRGKGKALNQLREHLAQRGYRLPEDVLAQMAGLATRDDAITAAMVAAERIVTWAYAGKTETVGSGDNRREVAAEPSPSAMMRAFELVYSAQLRALDALLPYGLAKVTPDGGAGQPIVVVVPAGQAAPVTSGPAAMRDVTPRPAGRMRPADVQAQTVEHQALSRAASGQSDEGSRTE